MEQNKRQERVQEDGSGIKGSTKESEKTPSPFGRKWCLFRVLQNKNSHINESIMKLLEMTHALSF